MAYEKHSRSDLREEDATIDVIKWSLLLITVLTEIFMLFVLRQHWIPRDRRDFRTYTILCHCLIGFFLLWYGFYSALAELRISLTIFASLLMLDIVMAIFVKEHMKVCAKINLSLYTSCAVLAFIEAHLLQRIKDKYEAQ